METWDPLPAERTYYRSRETGDLGYLVRRDGKDKIRLDRPMQEIIIPFVESSWDEEREFKPYTRNQARRLAFEADKMLCGMSGLHKEAKRDWLMLKDHERIAFMNEGPGPGHLRAALFKAICGVLDKYSR